MHFLNEKFFLVWVTDFILILAATDFHGMRYSRVVEEMGSVLDKVNC